MPLRSTIEIRTQIILLKIDGFLKGWILNITLLKYLRTLKLVPLLSWTPKLLYRLKSLKFCGMELNFRSVIDKVGPCRPELGYNLESFGRQTSQFSAGPRRRRFSKIQR